MMGNLKKGIISSMERKNINRGFKNLRVWQDAVSLYMLAATVFTKFPYPFKKVASNSIDAAHSISRNIAEGYCRKSLKEYLNFLNIALASCGEFHSCYESCRAAGQINDTDYKKIEELHYRIENSLVRLISSLRAKAKEGSWDDDL